MPIFPRAVARTGMRVGLGTISGLKGAPGLIEVDSSAGVFVADRHFCPVHHLCDFTVSSDVSRADQYANVCSDSSTPRQKVLRSSTGRGPVRCRGGVPAAASVPTWGAPSTPWIGSCDGTVPYLLERDPLTGVPLRSSTPPRSGVREGSTHASCSHVGQEDLQDP